MYVCAQADQSICWAHASYSKVSHEASLIVVCFRLSVLQDTYLRLRTFFGSLADEHTSCRISFKIVATVL